MRRTYDVPFRRAGLAGLVAALILLCLPGTSIAGGAPDTTPALKDGSGLLHNGAGYGSPRERRSCAPCSASCTGSAGSRVPWTGCTAP